MTLTGHNGSKQAFGLLGDYSQARAFQMQFIAWNSLNPDSDFGVSKTILSLCFHWLTP